MQISQNMVSWPSSWLSHKIKPSVDFVQNMSKICWDIDQNVPFKWVVASHFDCLKKLTLVHEGLVPLHQEFTELLTKMCSFSQNHGVVTPHFDCLKKLFLVHKGFMPIRREFTEILTKMCSFSQNMGLLPLILTVSKN